MSDLDKRTIQEARDEGFDDAISRKTAIDALADYIHNVDKVYSTGKLSAYDCKDAAWSVLGELPSAEPKIIRCKDCVYWDVFSSGSFAPEYHECVKRIFHINMRADDFCSRAERRHDDVR